MEGGFMLNTRLLILACCLAVTLCACEEKVPERPVKQEKEEPGFGRNHKFEGIYQGVEITLSYDRKMFAFVGMAKNASDVTVPRLRVKVRLSNGKTLGPTIPTDLKPGEEVELRLTTGGKPFEWWKVVPLSDVPIRPIKKEEPE
jgi:hypothetical protein